MSSFFVWLITNWLFYFVFCIVLPKIECGGILDTICVIFLLLFVTYSMNLKSLMCLKNRYLFLFRIGTPWSASEHRSFLLGLTKLGKGDWKGISKNYVPTRTPTQVASHAQKYFIRMTTAEKKNRRASLFDIPFKESVHHLF